MTTAMAVIASEQIWPNLHGILHWRRDEGGLDSLFIYCSEDQRRSVQPARRLRELVERELRGIRVTTLEDRPGGATPEAVRGQLQRWMEEAPHDRWIINATGGTKLMTLGAAHFAGRDGVRVVYEELSGRWTELSRDVPGDGIASRPLAIDRSAADAIPVQLLVELQFEKPPEAAWSFSLPPHLDIPSLVRAGLQSGWRWQEAFALAGQNRREKEGLLFEKFVAASILEFGVSNQVINLRLSDAGGKHLQEIDIVASSGGRVFIFDCKLRYDDESEEYATALSAQITSAAMTRRNLGGLSAVCVLVRPTWPPDAGRNAFAAVSGVAIIDRDRMASFFRVLSDILGIPMPPAGAEAQSLLDGAAELCRYPFHRPSKLTAMMGHPYAGSAILPLANMAQAYMEEHDQDWFACEARGEVIIIWKVPDPSPDKAVQALRMLADRLDPFGPVETSLTGSGKTAYLILRPGPRAKELSDALRTARGKTLRDL